MPVTRPHFTRRRRRSDVDISDERFHLRASGNYALQLAWPTRVASDGAKAKFVKKSRSLKVTLPLP